MFTEVKDKLNALAKKHNIQSQVVCNGKMLYLCLAPGISIEFQDDAFCIALSLPTRMPTTRVAEYGRLLLLADKIVMECI